MELINDHLNNFNTQNLNLNQQRQLAVRELEKDYCKNFRNVAFNEFSQNF